MSKKTILIIVLALSGSVFAQGSTTNCIARPFGQMDCYTTNNIGIGNQIGGSSFLDLNAYSRGAEMANQHNQLDMQRQQLLMQQQQIMQQQQLMQQQQMMQQQELQRQRQQDAQLRQQEAYRQQQSTQMSKQDNHLKELYGLIEYLRGVAVAQLNKQPKNAKARRKELQALVYALGHPFEYFPVLVGNFDRELNDVCAYKSNRTGDTMLHKHNNKCAQNIMVLGTDPTKNPFVVFGFGQTSESTVDIGAIELVR